MRGLVYRNAAGKLELLTFQPGTLNAAVGELNDDSDGRYSALPSNKADVVEVMNENEVIGCCTLKSLYTLTFDRPGITATQHAHAAIAKIWEYAPEQLIEMLQ